MWERLCNGQFRRTGKGGARVFHDALLEATPAQLRNALASLTRDEARHKFAYPADRAELIRQRLAELDNR